MLNYFFVSCDAPTTWQFGFQDPASPVFNGIVTLHDTIIFYLTFIAIGVFWILCVVLFRYNSNKHPISLKYSNHGTIIETIWTIIPAIVLIVIAFPSFRLLYIMDEVIHPSLTIKAIGNQWFWSYQLSDFVNDDGESIEFDSYAIPTSDLEDGQFRLLDTDNPVLIPTDTHVRFVVTSNDVIHDWAVPSLGIKIDANPGRLNQVSALSIRDSTYYGICSELCGTIHSNMPIMVKSVGINEYIEWLNSMV